MKEGLFFEVAANTNNPKWNILIKRETPLYDRDDDIRSEFTRDYTRILHSLAYRRLKHKTQVFFNTHNDHICTRIEHVNHVESISRTVSSYLGLNTDLAGAIAIGHDLGHSPFGHQGEKVLEEIYKDHLSTQFWHEMNGLYCVDNIELLEDNNRNYRNLDLTYGVRDGIISHCGELDELVIAPRDEAINLYQIESTGSYQPFTWEACVVKLSDKIAYIGRDIEDAIRLNFIGRSEIKLLRILASKYDYECLNTTLIIHELITDLCRNSNPQIGLVMSQKNLDMMKEIKDFNYKHIYNNKKFEYYKRYVKLILKSIFDALLKEYNGESTIANFTSNYKSSSEIRNELVDWLLRYSSLDNCTSSYKYKNKKIYNKLDTKEIYIKAILDFISGMTDQYAIKVFNELTSF